MGITWLHQPHGPFAGQKIQQSQVLGAARKSGGTPNFGKDRRISVKVCSVLALLLF